MRKSMFKNIDKEKLFSVLLTASKIISFLSLVMTVTIKTRVLLGLSNGVKDEKDAKNENNV
jgi:hypothetical protein